MASNAEPAGQATDLPEVPDVASLRWRIHGLACQRGGPDDGRRLVRLPAAEHDREVEAELCSGIERDQEIRAQAGREPGTGRVPRPARCGSTEGLQPCGRRRDVDEESSGCHVGEPRLLDPARVGDRVMGARELVERTMSDGIEGVDARAISADGSSRWSLVVTQGAEEIDHNAPTASRAPRTSVLIAWTPRSRSGRLGRVCRQQGKGVKKSSKFSRTSRPASVQRRRVDYHTSKHVDKYLTWSHHFFMIISKGVPVVRIKIAAEQPARREDDARPKIGWREGLEQSDLWDRGRAAWKLKAEKVLACELALIAHAGVIRAVGTVHGVSKAGDRLIIEGAVIEDHPLVGQSDPLHNTSQNPVAYGEVRVLDD